MRATLFALCLIPQTTTAQSVSETVAMMSEYASAYATFGIGDMSYDWENMIAGTDAMLTGMTGRWVNAGILAAGAELPAHIIADACARNRSEIVRQGPFDFNMIRTSGNERSLTVTYSYVFARSFQVSADLDQVQNFLGIDLEDRPFQQIYTNPAYRGIVEVFHPSPRIIVIQAQGALADIYMRCP